jgi:hypothetical protein
MPVIHNYSFKQVQLHANSDEEKDRLQKGMRTLLGLLANVYCFNCAHGFNRAYMSKGIKLYTLNICSLWYIS